MPSSCVGIIVDAYSSGWWLAPAFWANGWECIHVQSSATLPEVYASSFRPQNFLKNFVWNGDLQEMLSALKAYHPGFVVPGAETGVVVADILSEALGTPTNGTRLSDSRRNKFVMIETLRAAGIKVAQQIKSKSSEELIDWARTRGEWPVVLKPLASALTDSVRLCHNADEIDLAFSHIYGKTNQLGLTNEAVLAQEYLRGTEYIVDSVSCRGSHYITSIWKYQKVSKNGSDFVYDRVELVPSSGSIPEELSNYVYTVLDALGVVEGAGHSEVMMTGDGPRLVEMAARLDGADMPILHRACLGQSQIEYLVAACTNLQEFNRLTQFPYQILRHGLEVDLISQQEGTVDAMPRLGELYELNSFFSAQLKVDSGMMLKKTIDMKTCPGIVHLVHEDKAIVERDYEAIRRFEREGFYQVGI